MYHQSHFLQRRSIRPCPNSNSLTLFPFAGSAFLLPQLCVCVCVCVCVHARYVTSVVSGCLRPCGLWPTRLLCPWGSPGKSAGVSFHALLQGIFPTQGWNPRLSCLLHRQADSYPLCHQGSPRPPLLYVKPHLSHSTRTVMHR